MKICASTDIPAGAARGFIVPGPGAGLALVLVRAPEGLRAYENRCPHRGVNLDWNPGVFLDPEGQYLQCATHGALFRPGDGHCVAGPCAGQGLRPVPVREQAGAIHLDSPTVTAHGA